MHEVLINRLGGLSLPRKSVVRLTDRPDMTLDVYCGCKTTIQQQHNVIPCHCRTFSNVIKVMPSAAVSKDHWLRTNVGNNNNIQMVK